MTGLDPDGIVIGSPTYFAAATSGIKKFIDDSIKHFKKLEGKAGATFASSGYLGGGAETAILDILRAFLVHGMVIQGCLSGGITAQFPPELRMRSARKYAKILVPGSQGSSRA